MRLHEDELRRAIAAHRGVLLAGLGSAAALLTAISALEGSAPGLLVRSAAWLDIYAILGLVFVLASRMRGVPTWLRFVSDASYALYLFHLFFLIPAKSWFPPPENAVSWEAILLPWAIGLALPLALVAAGRALLGSRSRSVIGA